MTDRELLDALAFDVDLNLRRHVSEAPEWQPHDLVPWADGRNFAFMGGEDWSPEQVTLSETATLALTVGVLVADNMPAYHRELAAYLRFGPWWGWVGRWTAEENRHAIVIRNYLMVTRSVDPVELERARMAHMTAGMAKPPLRLLDILVEAAFDEAAAAVRHRNTAALNENPTVTAICNTIAADDERQSEFFAGLVDAAIGVAPEQVEKAVRDRVAAFSVPAVALPGGRDGAAAMVETGIFDLDKERDRVFAPLLERWNVDAAVVAG